jgi:ABC-2 type transport system permease protein
MAGVADRFFYTFRLDAAKQRTLVRLRMRLTRRQFEREPGKIVGFLVFLAIFGPLILLLAGVSGFLYIAAPDPWPVQTVGIVLSGLWLAWIVLPLFAFRTNEALDLSRLLLYPLRTRDLVASALIGSLFDGPSYVTLPFFIAIIVGWYTDPLLLIIILPALLLAYLLMIASGQLVLTASMGLLRSRRFRDLTIVVFSLLGSSCYFINRGIESWASALGAEAIRQFEPLLILRWLPPGACAQAVASGAQGLWIEALLWLGYGFLWFAALLWAWWKLLMRMTTGASAWTPPTFETAPHQDVRGLSFSDRLAVLTARWLPAPVLATALKEIKLIWRVPQRRIGLLQSILGPFVLIFAVFFGEMDALSRLPEWTAMGLPAIMFFSAWGLGTNMIGMESRGLATLLLTPAPRRQIFAGKGIAYAVMALIPTSIYALVLGFAARSMLIFYGLLAGIGAALAVIAVNTIASIYFTFPFDENTNTRQRAGGGFVTGLAQIIVVPLAMMVAVTPATLPMLLGILFDRPEFAALGAPLGVLYAVILFVWATRRAGKLLEGREAEVLAAANLVR